jgi:hypothetical protein
LKNGSGRRFSSTRDSIVVRHQLGKGYYNWWEYSLNGARFYPEKLFCLEARLPGSIMGANETRRSQNERKFFSICLSEEGLPGTFLPYSLIIKETGSNAVEGEMVAWLANLGVECRIKGVSALLN